MPQIQFIIQPTENTSLRSYPWCLFCSFASSPCHFHVAHCGLEVMWVPFSLFFPAGVTGLVFCISFWVWSHRLPLLYESCSIKLTFCASISATVLLPQIILWNVWTYYIQSWIHLFHKCSFIHSANIYGAFPMYQALI